jgi:hypothetical protein
MGSEDGARRHRGRSLFLRLGANRRGLLTMWNRRQQTEAALVRRERRQREDEAPRLRQEVRQLAALDIEIDEYRAAAGSSLAARHTRRIVVECGLACLDGR